MLWRQPNSLVAGEKVWDALRRAHPDAKVANVCWWYAMGMDVDTIVTPRPIYHADGRKSARLLHPPDLAARRADRGARRVPALPVLGPDGIHRLVARGSSRPPAGSCRTTTSRWPTCRTSTTTSSASGRASPQARAAASELDAALAPLLDDAARLGVEVVVLSEYGITEVDQPVAPQPGAAPRRAARGAHPGRDGVPRPVGLDARSRWPTTRSPTSTSGTPTASRRCARCSRTRRASSRCSTGPARRHTASTTSAAATSCVVADPRAWFTYYYWLDDDRAPDFARGVEIHRKPGYDPAELFFDPADRSAKARAGLRLVRKKLGLRYSMSVVPLDAALGQGQPRPAARRPGRTDPCCSPRPAAGCVRRVAATDVHDLVLEAAGVERRRERWTTDRPTQRPPDPPTPTSTLTSKEHSDDTTDHPLHRPVGRPALRGGVPTRRVMGL